MPKDNLQIVHTPGSREGVRIMKMKGALSIHTVFTFQDATRQDSSPVLILDFSEVPFIDSGGLGALVAAHISAHKSMRKLGCTGMNTQVSALVEMTHVNQLLKIFPSVKDAEAGLS